VKHPISERCATREPVDKKALGASPAKPLLKALIVTYGTKASSAHSMLVLPG